MEEDEVDDGGGVMVDHSELSYARINELASSVAISNNQLFQSALADKSSTFRNAISEQVANCILKVMKPPLGRRPVVIRFDLTIDENYKLQESFPEYEIRIENATTHAHAFSAAHRHLEYNRLLDKIGYNKVNGMISDNAIQVIDVGGDYAKNLIAGNFGIHADCPLLDPRDHSRETTRRVRVSDYYSSTNFKPDSIQLKFLEQHNSVLVGSAGCKFYCHCTFEDCKVVAEKAIMLHSCYDIDFDGFATSMTRRGVKLVYGSFNFTADMLYKSKGIQDDSRYTWDIDLQSNKIKFGFVKDASFMYVHNLTNYLKWATKTIMRDDENGVLYLKELMESINGVQFFKISYAGNISETTINTAIYFPSISDKVLVKIFDFDFDSTTEAKFRLMCDKDANLPDLKNFAIYNPDQFIRGMYNDQGIKCKSILVNKNFMNELLLFVLGANETKFVPLEVFNMARSLIMRIVVGKEVIRAYKTIEARELFMLSQTIYILCYALKYAQGKVTQHLKTSVDHDRKLYHNNWFIKTLKCLPFCGGKPAVIPHRNFLVGWLHKAAYNYRKSAFPVQELLREGLQAVELETSVYNIGNVKVTSLPQGTVEYTDILLNKVLPSAPSLDELDDDADDLLKYYKQIELFDNTIYNKCVVDYKNVSKPIDAKNNSYIKLQELDSKFDLFGVIDVGELVFDVSVAPGGFVKYCNEKNYLVDGNVYRDNPKALLLYNGIRFNDVTFDDGDLYNIKVRKSFKRSNYKLVLCDASTDADGKGESNNFMLIKYEIEVAHLVCKSGGNVLLKIFIPNTDSVKRILEEFAGYFNSCDVFRCENTSKISGELYMVCKDYRYKNFKTYDFSDNFKAYKSVLEYNLLCLLKDMQDYEHTSCYLDGFIKDKVITVDDVGLINCTNSKHDDVVTSTSTSDMVNEWLFDDVIDDEFFELDAINCKVSEPVEVVSSNVKITEVLDIADELDCDIDIVDSTVSSSDDIIKVDVVDNVPKSKIKFFERTLYTDDYGYDFELVPVKGDGHCFFNCLTNGGDGKALRDRMKNTNAPKELLSDEYVGEETFLYVVQNYNIALYVHIISDDGDYVSVDHYYNGSNVNQVIHIAYTTGHYDLLRMVCRTCDSVIEVGGFMLDGLDVDSTVACCDCFCYTVPTIVPKTLFDVDKLNDYLEDTSTKVALYYGENHVFVVDGELECVSIIDFSNHVCTSTPVVGYRELVKGIYVNCCSKSVQILKGNKHGAKTLNFVNVKQSTAYDGFSASVDNEVCRVNFEDKVKVSYWLKDFIGDSKEVNIKSDYMIDFSWLVPKLNVDKVYIDVNIQKNYFSYEGAGNFKQNVRASISEQLCDWRMTKDKIDKELSVKAHNTVSTLTSGSIHNYADLFSDNSMGVIACTKVNKNWRSDFRVTPISLSDTYAMGYVTDGRQHYGLRSLTIKLQDKKIIVDGLDKIKLNSNSVYIYFNKDCKMDNSMVLYKNVVNLVTQEFDFTLKVFEGAPGIGKTYLMLSQHSWKDDIILTATKMGADEIRRRSVGVNAKEGLTEEMAKSRYMTIDSYLINGKVTCKTLFVDEALMVHAGSWLAAGIKSKCSKIVIIGDSAQIPYIDRNGFGCRLHHYSSLGDVEVVTKLCSFRIPCDVAYFINTLRKDGKSLYSGSVKTHNSVRRSLSTQMLDANTLNKLCTNKVVLTFSQADKADLIRRGIKANTVGESQGSQYDNVVLVRLNTKPLPLYSDIHQWLVALSRHKVSFLYLTSVDDNLVKQINTVNSSCDAQIDGCLIVKGGATTQFPSYNVIVNPPTMKNPLVYPRVIRDFVCAHNSTGLQSMLPVMVDAGLDVFVEPPVMPIWKVNDPLNVMQYYIDKLRPGSSCEYQRYDQYNYNYRDQVYPAFECSRFPLPSVPKIKDYLTPKLRVTCPVATLHNDRSVVKAFAERNGGVPEYTTQSRDDDLAKEMIKVFVDNCVQDKDLLDSYKDNPVELNSASIQQWLYTQPTGTVDCLEDEVHYNIFFRELNKYNYILKKVPKPDLEADGHMKFPAPQAIAHQPKQVNAYFCSMLRECKQRLLAVLKPNIIINSDMAPKELVRLLNHRIPTKNYCGVGNKFNVKRFWQKFLELDISKYDKSQQRVTLLSEIYFFILMGMGWLFIILWLFMHIFTCLMDTFTKFKAFVMYQRKSGDAWTFSGNTVFLLLILIFVLVVYFLVVIANIVLLVAGDDSIVFMDELTNIDKSKFYVLFGNLFNLEVKVFDYSVPYFCSKFFLPTEFGWVVIPDLWKLLIKLGRKDLVSFDHLREYQISLMDIIEPLRNVYNLPYISEAMIDRYKLDMSSDMLVAAIVTFIDDYMLDSYFVHENDVLGYYSTLPTLDI